MADKVWRAFGQIDNYVEPFFGSGAVLLLSPYTCRTETVNDADGFVSNFWRALAHDPEGLAHHADWPVNENDLHARHAWLVTQRETLTARLEGDPDFFDVKIAGWWVWGIACWIGSGWCSGKGPWQQINGLLVNTGNAGRGVKRKLVHLGDAGRGVNRKLEGLEEYFGELSARLRGVRVCCGDWSRVCGPTPTTKQGVTGIFFDPPYSEDADRDMNLYAKECGSVAHDVRRYCIERGDDPKMRIVLCGYEGEHNELERHGWTVEAWKAAGGYGLQGSERGRENSARERIWYSPHCVRNQAGLFA